MNVSLCVHDFSSYSGKSAKGGGVDPTTISIIYNLLHPTIWDHARDVEPDQAHGQTISP